jgi:hypothetical protein
MNCEINDAKLDSYISIIKDSDKITEKVSAYKKANRRLHTLQDEHVELCNMLKKPKKIKKEIQNEMNIDEILVELTNIDVMMNNNSDCMKELIEKYVQYKILLDKLEIETGNMRNEIMKVEEKSKKITVQKMSIDDIF